MLGYLRLLLNLHKSLLHFHGIEAVHLVDDVLASLRAAVFACDAAQPAPNRTIGSATTAVGSLDGIETGQPQYRTRLWHCHLVETSHLLYLHSAKQGHFVYRTSCQGSNT